MRLIVLLFVVMAVSATALGQPDQRAMLYAGAAALPCGNQALSVRHITDDAAMGGLRTIDYAFKDISSSACALKGYPRFRVVG